MKIEPRNICNGCQELYWSDLHVKKFFCYCSKCREELLKKERATKRKEVSDAMKSLGITKVKGSLGGTYWE